MSYGCGAMNGAASGAAVGTSVMPGWGTAIGAVIGGIGGALGDKAKSKAAKRKLKMMQQALRMYQAGSTDAFGNTLSADGSGRWSYNLTPSTQYAVNGANAAMRELGSYRPKSFSSLLGNTFLGNNFANNYTANASQSNAMRRALQQGSNIGVISTAYNNSKMNDMRKNLSDSYQTAQNHDQYNANNRRTLGESAYYTQLPVNTIQSNLQDMVNNLNKTEMDQMNAMAGAGAAKTLAGRSTTANMFKALGGGINAYDQNQQQKAMYDRILSLYEKYPQLMYGRTQW